MEPVTTAVISTIFLTKALERSGERFSDAMIDIMKKVIDKIRQYSPETAVALESGDEKILNLERDVPVNIPADLIFEEFLATAEIEQSTKFQKKYQAIKSSSNIKIIGKQLNFTQSGDGNIQNNTFGDF